MIDIRQCQGEEIRNVMAFLRDNWKREHILSYDRSMMTWQHGNANHSHNYLVAWLADQIVGILGYIPYRRYDPDLSPATVFLALWKVLDGVAGPGTGVRMLRTLHRQEHDSTIAVSGITESALPLYRSLRYTVGQYDHHILLNHGTTQTIATVPSDMVFTAPNPGTARLNQLSKNELETSCAALDVGERAKWLPAKSPRYFLNRYLRHPVYQYTVYGAYIDNSLSGLLAVRRVVKDYDCILRIVDFYGTDDTFGQSGQEISELCVGAGAQYIDILSAGLSADALRQAGFVPANVQQGPSVPNHFEPFDRYSTAPVNFAIDTDRPFVLFRADGDQDRPNSSQVFQSLTHDNQ